MEKEKGMITMMMFSRICVGVMELLTNMGMDVEEERAGATHKGDFL
jgi:hypothetical protein